MFDNNTQEKLKYYVYALFDARKPALPFYIGKGSGNRVFSHTNAELLVEDEETLLNYNIQKIRSIKESGHSIIHKIIRYGLTENEAFKVEASLIDLANHIHPNTLQNQISGHGVEEGFYDAHDLAIALNAAKMNCDLPLLIIKIERRWDELIAKFGSSTAIPFIEIYEATKGNWRIDHARAGKTSFVLAVAKGIVRAVIFPMDWEDSVDPHRKQMSGYRASSEYEQLVGTSVAHIFERGSQNPVRYRNC